MSEADSETIRPAGGTVSQETKSGFDFDKFVEKVPNLSDVEDFIAYDQKKKRERFGAMTPEEMAKKDATDSRNDIQKFIEIANKKDEIFADIDEQTGCPVIINKMGVIIWRLDYKNPLCSLELCKLIGTLK